MPFYYWTSKKTGDDQLGHLGKKKKYWNYMFQPLSLKLNSGLTTTVTLCFSLHLLTLCKITTWTDAFYMTRLSQICWIVCLFHRKTSIKIIYLFLGTWQEANMLYFPGQKAENFLKVALMSWFQSKNWYFQQIFGAVTFPLSMGIYLKSGQTTNSWKTTVWPPKVSSSQANWKLSQWLAMTKQFGCQPYGK